MTTLAGELARAIGDWDETDEGNLCAARAAIAVFAKWLRTDMALVGVAEDGMLAGEFATDEPTGKYILRALATHIEGEK